MNKKSIVFILMMSLLPYNFAMAEDNEQLNINLTGMFDSDLFLKTTTAATSAYNDGLYYYDGSKYESSITFTDLTYKLDGDMDTKANDVIKINTSSVSVPLENNPSVKRFGFVLFTRDAGNEATVTVTYENDSTDEYKITVPQMTEEAEVTGTNPLKVVKSGIRWYPKEDTSVLVYLKDTIIDNSLSPNKNLGVKSVTFGSSDKAYYLAAATFERFSEDELNSQTQQIVKDLFAKYSEVNLIQLAMGEDGLNIDEANELYSSLLMQNGKMEEATEENIEKIKLLTEGASLYSEIIGYKDAIENLIGQYADVSADFEELTETNLTNDDYNNLSEILENYDKAEVFDNTRLLEIAQIQDVTGLLDIEIETEGKTHIQSLYKAYEKALKKAGLREKINPVYDEYITKSIEQISDADIEALTELIGYFEEAEEAGIVFEEYEIGYIEHLYNDFEVFKTSESYKAIDISRSFNVDTIGKTGDMVNEALWYECADNLSGEKFKNPSYHANISSFDAKNETLYLKEHIYEEKSSYDEVSGVTSVNYEYVPTGNLLPVKMSENMFDGGVADALLIESDDTASYTFNLSGTYTDKIYFTTAAAEGVISPVITYADGSKETVSVKVNSTAQTTNELRNKKYTYPDMISYITSGDYKNINKSDTGVLYKPTGNVTNGWSVFGVKVNPEKKPASITFKAMAKSYLLFGVGEIPVLNSVVSERVNELYAQVVKDGNVDTSDMSVVSELVLNYSDAKARGLYFENVDKDIMKELSEMVLSASGEVFREGKENVKANISFSVPVDKNTLEEAVAVLIDKEETDFIYELSEDETELVIDIPVTRNGTNVIEVKVSDSVKIKSYPEIGMVNELNISYNLPYYISAGYTENKNLTVTNNSAVSQDYIAYVTVADSGKIINSQMVSGTVSAGETVQREVSSELYASETSDIYAAVLDADTLKPLFEITEPLKTTAAADLTADYKKPSLNLVTDVLTISGVSPLKTEGSVISVIINSPLGECLYAGEVLTVKDGFFALDIALSAEKIPVSGYLDIKISGDDFYDAEVISDVYFPVMSDRAGEVNSIRNADINSVRALLINAKQTLSLNFAPYEECVNEYLTGLSSRIVNIKSSLPEILDSDSEQVKNEKISLAQKLIKQQAVLECIKNNRKEFTALNSQLLYEDVMDYKLIDTNGVTLYSLYKNDTSAVGKEAVVNGICGKNYTSVTELYDSLEKLIMLNSLKFPALKGVGHVQKILTKANADAAGISIKKYLDLINKTQADSHIANMTINSLDDVTAYINTLSNPQVNKPAGGGGGGGGGGAAATTSPSVAIVTNTETIPSLAEEKSPFGDMGVSHWAYEAVKSLYDKGIINGSGNGKFNPDDTVTRAELVKLLCVAKGIEPVINSGRFKDVSDSDWYAGYVGAVSGMGIVNGISDTEFGSYESISRQDLCTIIYRAENAEGTYELRFNDSDLIADYAKPAVAYLNEMGIVNGFADGSFKPTSGCTRAEAAMIIYNYLKL